MARIGVARWPKWRLFGFRSDPVGTLTLKLDGARGPCRLLLNYECQPSGSIRVSLANLPDRTEANAIPLTGSSLAAPAAWKDGDLLAPGAKGGSVQATLHMDRPRSMRTTSARLTRAAERGCLKRPAGTHEYCTPQGCRSLRLVTFAVH
mgnify:CR=1 FL=1